VAFAFYFAEGAPIGFIWWAMPTLLRKHGVGLDVIGTFTAMLTLPWVLKFLWAPLIDIFRSKRFGYSGWIGVSQLLMCITLLPLVFIPLEGNVGIWGTCLLLHSICAATQDVSVDALVINLVAGNEKGLLNGFMQAGMLLGRSLFGGGALLLVSFGGLHLTIAVMILVILCTMLLLLFIKEPTMIHIENRRFVEFTMTLRSVFSTRRTWFAIAFALTAAAAFESVGAMAGPFLTDKKTDTETIGVFFSFPVVISMLIGGLIGGYISDKIKRHRSTALFLCGFVLMAMIISVIGFIFPNSTSIVWISLFTLMYFFIGMFTAASYALFMDVSDPKLGATQFSTFMAATNGCEAWVVWTTGIIVAHHSYGLAFLLMALVSVGSLLFLKSLKAE
jgi:MFS family permease